MSKRWREQLARRGSFAGRSTPREQDSWRNSCNWLHFGSETTKEVSSCTSNGVTVVLKILVSHLSHWIPSHAERKRVFSIARERNLNVVPRDPFLFLHARIKSSVVYKSSNIFHDISFFFQTGRIEERRW